MLTINKIRIFKNGVKIYTFKTNYFNYFKLPKEIGKKKKKELLVENQSLLDIGKEKREGEDEVKFV